MQTPGQVQQGSREGSGEGSGKGLGGFLVQRPGQIPQGIGEGFAAGMRKRSGRNWCRRRVRFNNVPEEVLEGLAGFCADAGPDSKYAKGFQRRFR